MHHVAAKQTGLALHYASEKLKTTDPDVREAVIVESGKADRFGSCKPHARCDISVAFCLCTVS